MNIEYKDIKDFPDKLVIAMKNFKTVYSAWDGAKLVGMICAMDDGIMNAYVHFQQDFLMLVLGYVILAYGMTIVIKSDAGTIVCIALVGPIANRQIRLMKKYRIRAIFMIYSLKSGANIPALLA